MENTILLHGTNYEADKERIEASACKGAVFLLDEPQTELYQYIDYLYEECGLRTKILNKLRICRQIDFKGKITLYSSERQELCKPRSMEALLRQLQPGNRFRLVIENNDRTLMANIVQQLIYINYPLTEVNVTLRSEEKDAKKTDRFMHHIQALQIAAQFAVDKINELCIDAAGTSEETRERLYKTRAEALTSYQKICEQIKKAQDVEMKVAVAASKKTGKSVLVNCMLGVELAPTSPELATPNNCIYKRSPDNCFHLQTAGKDDVENFDSLESLRERISKAFKMAQENVETHFACEDMLISYVSNGNNFESYTIYDTPGPDLAGAAHDDIADKAVKECDVAIFAIDYTKYLTTSEEKFLKKIKNIFQAKNKFHTLIFVINKIDQALNDKGTKSRIKSIDFIRTRLREIDDNYEDCIVFATSAQDYFWSLELENAAERLEELSCLRGKTADLYQNLRPCKDALEEDCEEEDLIHLMSNLDGEVGRVRSQLGYPTVDMETLRLYSGIPQLMGYVSYIARSKAREEIVNSITHDIAAQCRMLQALISQIANMEELMNKTQQEIDQISAILDNYVAAVQKVLAPDLAEKDINCLDPTKLLHAQIDKFQKQSGDKLSPIKLQEILCDAREGIAHLRESTVQREIWNRFCPAYMERVNGLVGRTVPKEKLDVSQDEMQGAIAGYLMRVVNQRVKDEVDNINSLVGDLESVVKNRMERVITCTKDCQDQLEKSDCYLQLPKPPAFEVALPAPELNNRIIVDRKLGISSQLKGIYKEVKGIEKFFRNIFVHGNFDCNKKEVKVKERLVEEDMVKLQGPFYNILADAQVYPGICRVLDELNESVKRAEDEVLARFSEMNNTCTATVEAFKRGIDDRSYYEDKLSDYAHMKNLIASIQSASRDFMDIWALVVEGQD